MSAHILNKQSTRYRNEDLEYWAEDGLIYMEDHRCGDFNVITCADFAARARAINLEAKRAKYQVDRDNWNSWVLNMHECWKEAKAQGDPGDPVVMKQRYKERRKAIMVTGMWQ